MLLASASRPYGDAFGFTICSARKAAMAAWCSGELRQACMAGTKACMKWVKSVWKARVDRRLM